ncbi:hypothetical protein QU487_11740 [Crenobacter sp. SG2305]|uniref:hypothetical protein n=1 Tax=Crenobacter oryzisoli TaxID=3056844 RepID=UPI0025AB397A|nr:hypothetical protein [Crenobacter sp. SG2305]MDN0083416.1 hypothetical protein [Crenobacter sp. SG2305]
MNKPIFKIMMTTVIALSILITSEAWTKELARSYTASTECCDEPVAIAYGFDRLPQLSMHQGKESAKIKFHTKNIFISSIIISEVNKEGISQQKGWIVLNSQKNCKPEFPDIIAYGMKLPSCLEVKRHDKYNKKAEYIIILTGITDKSDDFEFFIDTSKIRSNHL